MTSALALVHQRFSTNTFPSWPLAHPYRYICHNGEINTLRGNNNWMAARQATMSSDVLGKDLEKVWPVSYEGQSDSACFDNALELSDHRRLLAAPRHDDADPGGVGRQPFDERRAANVL
jgi:glutamate synthase (NADPH) large chain